MAEVNGSIFEQLIKEHEDLQNMVSALDELSVLRRGFSSERFGLIRRELEVIREVSEAEACEIVNQIWEKLPPLYTQLIEIMMVGGRIESFDSELTRLAAHPDGKMIAERFVDESTRVEGKVWNDKQVRAWLGRLFEIRACGCLVSAFGSKSIEFESPLPNGRNSDVRLLLDGKPIRIELTCLNADDEYLEVYGKWRADRHRDPSCGPLVRPGKYDPCDAKGPSQLYNAVRFFCKVYDKLAPKFNPAKSQCSNSDQMS